MALPVLPSWWPMPPQQALDLAQKAWRSRDLAGFVHALRQGARPDTVVPDHPPMLVELAQEGLLPWFEAIERWDRAVRWDACGPSGETALMRAVRCRHRVLAVWMLDRKANPNAQDREGNTPLHAAIETGQSALQSALTQAGARWDRPNGAGESPETLLARLRPRATPAYARPREVPLKPMV